MEKKYEKIQSDLLYTDLTQEEIAEYHGVSRVTVSNINTGKTHKTSSYSYPLRTQQEIIKEEKKEYEIIQDELILSRLSIRDVAEKYNKSLVTIYNINSGKTHYNKKLTYPLHRKSKLSNEEIYFVNKYKNNYSVKQLHIIIGNHVDWRDVSKARNIVPPQTLININKLEKRKKIFDFLITPRRELLNTSTGISPDDAIYIQFLGRFGASIDKVIFLFIDYISQVEPLLNYIPKTVEEVKLYRKWGGSKSRIIWLINQIYSQRVRQIRGSYFYWDDFNIELLKPYCPEDWSEYKTIINSFINCKTLENFTRRDGGK